MKSKSDEEVGRRLARIQGQVRGLIAMVEDDRECVDVLTQVAALRAALDSMGSLILMRHISECLCPPGEGPELEERVERVRTALARFIS